MGIGCLDVRIDRAKRNRRQSLRSGSTGKWSRIVRRNRNGGQFRAGSQRDHAVIRRILDDVECDVSEVAFISDAVPAAKRRSAIACHIPSKASARRKIVPVSGPEAADRTIRSDDHLAGSGLQLDVGSRTKIEVGIQTRIPVCLRPEVFPPQAEIDRQPSIYLPCILRVKPRFMENVTAREIRRADGEGQRASGSYNSADTWKLPLRIHSRLEVVELSGNQSINSRLGIRAE